jgi:hypothetical protein
MKSDLFHQTNQLHVFVAQNTFSQWFCQGTWHTDGCVQHTHSIKQCQAVVSKQLITQQATRWQCKHKIITHSGSPVSSLVFRYGMMVNLVRLNLYRNAKSHTNELWKERVVFLPPVSRLLVQLFEQIKQFPTVLLKAQRSNETCNLNVRSVFTGINHCVKNWRENKEGVYFLLH